MSLPPFTTFELYIPGTIPGMVIICLRGLSRQSFFLRIQGLNLGTLEPPWT